MSVEVALTFDDLPGVNAPVVTHILNTLRKHHLQGIYGFVNGLTLQLNAAHNNILQEWINAGNFLANHTFSHLNLSQVDVGEYLQDIKKNDEVLAKFTASGDRNKYFRYPFLDEGETYEKRNQVRQLLSSQHYQIVPATIYIEEYRWNTTFVDCLLNNNYQGLTTLKDNLVRHAIEMLEVASGYAQLLFGRNIKHVLLLHETMFNAYILDDILSAYQNAGVKFVALDHALSDEVYQINPDVIGVEYYGFLGQLRAARNIKLTEKLHIATKNFLKRYSDSYCSFETS
jgi:peptidoglycan-N-acetylglucosamine deacetylase